MQDRLTAAFFANVAPVALLCIRRGNGRARIIVWAARGSSGAMSRSVLYVVIAVLVVGIGVLGFAYYDHKRNTVLEIDVGPHGITVQKN
jgi:hypothetical protein